MTGAVKNILVPVDGSDGANHAAAFAARLAADTGASLTLLYVLDSSTPSMIGLASLSRDELEEAKRNVSEKAFQGALAVIGQAGTSVQREVRIGHPAQDIIDVAAKGGIDLIVMGSRGLSPMRELLVGSVSHKVVQHAPCAVTIVR